jgi:branched-chain amino acid transport system substrate-binding protein
MKSLMLTLTRGALAAALTACGVASVFAADLKVGLSVSLSGPNSSLGVPYAKGMQAALAYKPEINGRKVQLIVLDDGSDPTTAGRNARKLSRKTRSTCSWAPRACRPPSRWRRSAAMRRRR